MGIFDICHKKEHIYNPNNFNEVNTLTAICRRNYIFKGECEYQELKIGKRYHITHISVLRSSTDIMLSEFGHKEFNSVCFDIYENGKIIEYTQDPRFWAPYLREMYLDCEPETFIDEKE